jgi:hypothetical protein
MSQSALQGWTSVQLLAAVLWAMWVEYRAMREAPHV